MDNKQREIQLRLGSITTPFLFQYEMIIELGDEICSLLDSAFLGEIIDATVTNKCYGKIWFWVLGSYEFTRTLYEFKTNFSFESEELILKLKKDLALIRVPFAKQENTSKNRKIKMPKIVSETLISGIDRGSKDFVYIIGDNQFLFRELFNHFKATIAKVTEEIPPLFREELIGTK